MKPLCLECGLAPIRCKQKCQRCYNRSVYKPEKRSERNVRDRKRNAELRRARYLRTREQSLAAFREYRARKRGMSSSGVVVVSVKGWGCLA
jgi:hypothetical protein